MNILKRSSKYLKDVFTGGDFGVGTDTPTAKLDVDGTLRVRTVTTKNDLTSFVVVDGDGTVKSREIDTLLPSDVFIQSSIYDSTKKEILITMTNGSNFVVNLSDLQDNVDVKLIDEDGDTFVEVEKGADDDTVRFGAGGVDVLTMTDSKITAHKCTGMEGGVALPFVKSETMTATEANHTIQILAGTQSFNYIGHYPEVNSLGMARNNTVSALEINGTYVGEVGETITVSNSPFDGTYTILEVIPISGNQKVYRVDNDFGGVNNFEVPRLFNFGINLSYSNPPSNISTITLPEPSTITDGKVYELVAEDEGMVSISGAGYILGEGQTFDFSTKQTTYIKLQADTANNRYILLEQDRTFGNVVDTTAPASGTTFQSNALSGKSATDIDVWRDGSLEDSSSYTLDSATGTLTVVDAFQEESLKIRLT